LQENSKRERIALSLPPFCLGGTPSTGIGTSFNRLGTVQSMQRNTDALHIATDLSHLLAAVIVGVISFVLMSVREREKGRERERGMEGARWRERQ